MTNPSDKEALEILDKARKAIEHCDIQDSVALGDYMMATKPDIIIPFCEEFIRMKERLIELEKIVEDHKDLIAYRGSCK